MRRWLEMCRVAQDQAPSSPRFREMALPAQLFVGGVITVGAFQFIGEALRLPGSAIDWPAFIFLLVGTLISRLSGVTTPRYAFYHMGLSFIFPAFYLVGPAPAGILIMASYAAASWQQRQRWYLAAFNISMHFLSGWLAYQVSMAIMGDAGLLTFVGELGLLTGAVVYILVNHFLVALGVFFVRGLPRVQDHLLDFQGIGTDFLLLCIGASLAVLWKVLPSLSVLPLASLILARRVLGIPLLEEEARIDAKTQLYNAKHGNAVLERELQRARQLNQPLSVLMADLDGLRRVNNVYGHLVGDEVLKRVAEVIQSTVGARGIASRFGGEEFLIVLPGCDAHEAMAVAERIRKRVEGLSFSPNGEEHPIQITITVGVASYPDDAASPMDLLQRADAALYHGKDNGRNQVCMAHAAGDRLNGKHVQPSGHEEVSGSQNGAGTRIAGPIPAEGIDRRLKALVGVVLLAGAALWVYYIPRVSSLDLTALGILVALTWLSEGLALDLYMASTVSLGFVMSLAAAFLLGPSGVAVLAPVIALTHAYRRRPPWYQAAYNLAAHMMAGTAASLVFRVFEVPIEAATLPALILPSALAAGAYYAINVGLVSTAVALTEHRGPIQVWREQFQWLWIHYVALGFIALVLAVAYASLGIYGVFAFLIPLFIVRYAQKQYIDRTADNIRALKALNQDLLAANAEIRQVNEELLGLLAKVIDFRDPYVYNHSEQVAKYAVAIAQEMGLPAAQIDRLRRAAVCHDLGKVGIPDAILNKPGRLTDEEYQMIKEHVNIGAQLLESSHILHQLIPGVRYHHERWDGRGYPEHLAQEDIPLEARILAVADAVETMASDRPYKRGMAPEEILEELQRCAGTQFDPAVVQAFVRVIEREGKDFIVNSARSVSPSRRVQWTPQLSPVPG
ncbi:MAG TPA: diguanylate cyclase [Caldilineae bacterium]|nr:diguanylate cyclase [Caldilineae bacterium]